MGVLASFESLNNTDLSNIISSVSTASSEASKLNDNLSKFHTYSSTLGETKDTLMSLSEQLDDVNDKLKKAYENGKLTEAQYKSFRKQAKLLEQEQLVSEGKITLAQAGKNIRDFFDELESAKKSAT